MGCCGTKQEAKVAPSPLARSLSGASGSREDIRDKYHIGCVLGSGSFGQVRKAVMKGQADQVRAVKVIERDEDDGGEWSNWAIFIREIELLQEIKHENIIRYYDFYEDLHFLYVVMELCRGGEVFAKVVELKRFSEKDAAHLGKQMIAAIAYIHNLHIVHRDVKAENFMLQESSIDAPVKMIDFGMATRFKDDEVLTELCGSPHYLSPELIGQKYNHLVDVWAFGVLMYLLLYGHYPHDAKQPKDIMTKILMQPIPWSKGKARLSRDTIAFLKRLLTHDPARRISADEALAHTWIQQSRVVETKEEAAALISPSVLRSAHKHSTATKKAIDQKIEEERNQKLKVIEEDFTRGIRHGKRLGPTPQEEYMSKPEFVRRENKLSTAPGGWRGEEGSGGRRPSVLQLKLQALVDNVRSHPRHSVGGGETTTVEDKSKETKRRRLSQLGRMTTRDETHFANLFQDRGPPDKDRDVLSSNGSDLGSVGSQD